MLQIRYSDSVLLEPLLDSSDPGVYRLELLLQFSLKLQ